MFKDHFSQHAEQYAQYRPSYPEELFDYLASISPTNQLAWDCATGNGQVAVELSKHFSYVIGTDASEEQIYHAMDYPRVEYKKERAENASFKDQSVDLITVAQALHWFDFDAFFSEVSRVTKNKGILAVLSYRKMRINAEIDAVVETLYQDILDAYWSPERKHVENAYSAIQFPFKELKPPNCTVNKNWSYNHLIGYLNTWSATQKYIKKNSINPVTLIEKQLKQAWNQQNNSKKVSWPVTLRIFET